MEFSKLYYDIYDDYSDEESDNDEGEETNEGMGGWSCSHTGLHRKGPAR